MDSQEVPRGWPPDASGPRSFPSIPVPPEAPDEGAEAWKWDAWELRMLGWIQAVAELGADLQPGPWRRMAVASVRWTTGAAKALGVLLGLGILAVLAGGAWWAAAWLWTEAVG